MFRFARSALSQCRKIENASLVNSRRYAARKRFYRKTDVLCNDGTYEITLDQRKLKTPAGNLLTVRSEPLALAVATEWDAQKDTIEQSTMHLTALCSTVIDNPNNLTKHDMVQYLVNYIDTDTVLYHSGEDDELYRLQMREWDPVLEWFRGRYNVNIDKSRDIGGAHVSAACKATIERHLLSYSFEAVQGFVFATDTVKSVILALACVDRWMSVERAVLLARLEEEFQTSHWGRVEWAHGLAQQDLQARLAAAVLFVHLHSSSGDITRKARPAAAR